MNSEKDVAMLLWNKITGIRDLFVFPTRVALVSTIIVLTINFLVAFLLNNMDLSGTTRSVAGSVLFFILSFPLLYTLVFRPLYNYITVQNAAERKVAESEKYLQLFYQSDLVGVFYWNKDGTIIRANEKFLELTGYSGEDVAKANVKWETIAPPDFSLRDEIMINELKVYGRSKRVYSQKFKRKDDSEIPVEITLTLLDKENVRGVGFVADIHEREERNRAGNEYSRNLEDTLRKNTTTLQKALNLKAAFLSNISHEIRTPLNAIIGFSGILLMGRPGVLSEEQKKQVEMIKSSGHHLLSLINGILDLSKIDAGEAVASYEKFAVHEAVASVIRHKEHFAQLKGIRIESRIPHLEIESDKTIVMNVLDHLVDNAIKFNKRDWVRVEVSWNEEEVVITVSDSGIGIKEEDKYHLFEPFSRIQKDNVREFEGPGLGLVLCKKQVSLIKGSLEVDSEFGVGSTFKLYLPRNRKD